MQRPKGSKEKGFLGLTGNRISKIASGGLAGWKIRIRMMKR
jgi:hypothetical protein